MSCVLCGKKEAGFQCGQCMTTVYCSAQCSKADWSRHSALDCRMGFVLKNGHQSALDNQAYRRVLYTTSTLQMVAMHLLAGEEIGSEIYMDTTQYFFVHGGQGTLILGAAESDEKTFPLENGTEIVVPPGVRHNVKASATNGLWLHTLYSPPHHEANTRQENK